MYPNELAATKRIRDLFPDPGPYRLARLICGSADSRKGTLPIVVRLKHASTLLGRELTTQERQDLAIASNGGYYTTLSRLRRYDASKFGTVQFTRPVGPVGSAERVRPPRPADFTPGDRVRILRATSEYDGTRGFSDKWVPNMDQYVGKVHRVGSINSLGVYIGEWYFPAQVLEKA